VNCGQITFPSAGLQILTLHDSSGNNLAYFEFVKASAAAAVAGAPKKCAICEYLGRLLRFNEM